MKVFILGGAGAVGSATAYCLTTRNTADEIVISDTNEDLAESVAMDLSQCAISVSGTRIRTGKWEDAKGSDVVVVAAGLPAALATHNAGKDIVSMLPMIRSIADGIRNYCPEAVVLSMTNPLDEFNYILYRFCNLPARQFIALSENDSIRFRYAISEHLNVNSSEVDGFVIGTHGPGKVPLFSSVMVNHEPRSFTAGERSQICLHMNTWWKKFLAVSGTRTATWTTGSSCALVIEHLKGSKSGPICCSCVTGDDFSIGLPVYLNASGVVEPLNLKLAEDESVGFEKSKSDLRSSLGYVLALLEEQGVKLPPVAD